MLYLISDEIGFARSLLYHLMLPCIIILDCYFSTIFLSFLFASIVTGKVPSHSRARIITRAPQLVLYRRSSKNAGDGPMGSRLLFAVQTPTLFHLKLQNITQSHHRRWIRIEKKLYTAATRAYPYICRPHLDNLKLHFITLCSTVTRPLLPNIRRSSHLFP